MRILHLLASPVWSGPAENVALLALAQRALGHSVWVAVDRKRASPPYEEPCVPKLRALELLDEGGLELCVKSMPWRMVTDALKLRRRRVEVIHSHFSHDHHLARWGRPENAVLIRSIHAPRSLRRSLPSADAWTVSSADQAHELQGHSIVLPPLLAEEYRPPKDRAGLRRELGIEGSPVIGMVSTFQATRRHELGLEAFQRLLQSAPGARLVLVGDGVRLEEIKALVAKGPIPGVIFAGYQSGAAFVRWLQSLDVVWILGLGNDFSGRAAAQARACGVRVLAAREGALPAYADEVLGELTPHHVALATLRVEQRTLALPSAAQVAAQVLSLYDACRTGRGP